MQQHNNTGIMSFVRLAYSLMGFRLRKVAMGYAVFDSCLSRVKIVHIYFGRQFLGSFLYSCNIDRLKGCVVCRDNCALHTQRLLYIPWLKVNKG